MVYVMFKDATEQLIWAEGDPLLASLDNTCKAGMMYGVAENTVLEMEGYSGSVPK